MADFLSPEWLETLNTTLAQASTPPLEDLNAPFRLVFEFVDGASSSPHALTFTVSDEGSSAELGDHLAANAVIRMSFADAKALTSGELDSASALREGKLKIRGDVHALVPLLPWLLAANSQS